MYKCEYCGKEVHEKFGSGRFCSRSCANGWVSKNQSDETKSKKSVVGKLNLVNYSGKHLSEEHKNKISDSVKMSFKENDVGNKISMSLRKYFDNNSVSDLTRQKLSLSMKRSIQEGKHKGWYGRKDSYPERFWMSVLDSNNIPYIREYKVTKSELGLKEPGCYFLDFYLLDKKIDIEIDGSQHLTEEQKSHDAKRTSELESKGYIVYRINWRNPKANSELVKSDIDEFIRWYDTCS